MFRSRSSGSRAEVLPFQSNRPDWGLIRRSAALIRRGEVLAGPTDTLYGLFADGLRSLAVEQVFRIKGRPENRPVLLLIDSPRALRGLVRERSPALRRLIAKFWPGPLTIVLPAAGAVPDAVTAGSGTVAVRCPAAEFPRLLARAAGRPLTGTSANLSGRPPSASALEVNQQLGSRVTYIVDGGPSRLRRPSTIVTLAGEPRILREGAIPACRLLRYLR
jgi:L-threonylcarbamoyladenylate synthase